MGPWISTHRVRFTAIVIILLAGAAAGSLLDAVAARLATFLLMFAIAIAIVALGASRPRGARRSAGEERDLAAERRDRVANTRDEAAEHRDGAAGHRDEAAEHRDADADAVQRNHDADQRDHDAGEFARRRAQASTEAGWNGAHPALAHQDDLNDSAAARTRARHDRSSGSTERRASEVDRGAALADRGASAGERMSAERDRGAALADRAASARERELASVDSLTGVLLRGAGAVELEHELARARRMNQPLALAFIDVDHLKTINDSRGHPAGDRMLREVAETLRASLRPYDVVIRYGGDEFVCALPGMDLAAAEMRLGAINRALADAAESASVTIGLAELQPGESVNHLVARADAELLRERHLRRGTHN